MAKLYTKSEKKYNKLNPKDETVSFILNYSKALKIVSYNSIKFEAIQN